MSEVWTDTTAFPLAVEIADADQLPLADMSAAAGSRQRNVLGSVARAQLGGAGGITSAPGVNDDAAAGYRRGSLVLTDAGALYVCTDATVGAAAWALFGTGDGDVVGPASAVDDRIATFDGTTGKLIQDGGKTIAQLAQQAIIIACSDETTDLATGTAVVTFRMPFAATLNSVKIDTTDAPTGSVLTVDLNEAGTSVLSTKLTIDAGEDTSATAATPAVISDSALANNAKMTVDIDGVGSTNPGKGLKLTMMVTPT